MIKLSHGSKVTKELRNYPNTRGQTHALKRLKIGEEQLHDLDPVIFENPIHRLPIGG